MTRTTPCILVCLVLSGCVSGNASAPAEPSAELPASAVAESGSEPSPERLEDVATITVELVNECADTKPFVLGPPEYPEVQPPADATVHELAAGERKTVGITPGQWFLHVDADGSFGSGGVSTTDDGARVTFSASPEGDCTAMQLVASPPA
jgi:hypothetical protein